MPLQATSGAASYDAFGGGVAAVPNYIEECFSCFLYTGNGSTQTITNGIDLSGKGGLVWQKRRDGADDNYLSDTTNELSNPPLLISNQTGALNYQGAYSPVNQFLSNGFNMTDLSLNNDSGQTFVSWTFRKQPKFFDVLTYTGNGVDGRQLPHNLGSTPGCVMFKRTDSTGRWITWHRSLPTNYYLQLQDTAGQQDYTKSLTPDATNLTLQTVSNAAFNINESGATYIAYLFAHDAGGFGLTGTDNVISCGSFTTDGSGNATINLGYEPQWIMQKCISRSGDNWIIIDDMRSFTTSRFSTRPLFPNTSGAEQASTFMRKASPTSDGFEASQEGTDQTFIYIAIRRGPMKVPTSGASVFSPVAASNSGNYVVNAGFPPDMVLATIRDFTSGYNHSFFDRLRGNSNYLKSSATDAESGVITDPTQQIADFSRNQNGIFISSGTVFAYSTLLGITYAWHNFRRAPSFFDEVCYTGTGAAMTVNHNLGAVPELIILKSRNNAQSWMVYAAPLGNNKVMYLNSSFESDSAGLRWNDTTPTSSVFSVGKFSGTTPYSSGSGYTYVAYLFATCAGVSKVGSYTGTATTLQVDCGFTGGARFVLIKKTSGTGSWYVWDSSRGIVSGNDPYLLLNSTAAEVTNTDYIDTYSAGFEISSTAPSEINENGGSFIFLAIS